jgi:glyoxylase-like metal-dependent hydrolase (beta-lactamase superfamily II)
MLNIHKITVPTPYLVGPVNCYLIKNRPYTLVDPGPDTAEAKKALMEGLSALGSTPADLERVVITHSHSDHSGLARWLSGQTGVPVYVHRLERHKLRADYEYYRERLPFLREAGLPGEVLAEIFNDSDPLERPVLTGPVKEVQGGETLGFDGGALRFLHLPGHSSGHICLFDPEQGNFLSGDFMLKKITPNPVMEADPAAPERRLPVLSQYLDGLETLKKLDIRLIWPGHGQNIEKAMESITRVIRHHQRRLEVISTILEENSWSAFQVMRFLYPQIKGFQIFLGLSEVFAHLDYLLERGRVNREDCGGISFYRKARQSHP